MALVLGTAPPTLEALDELALDLVLLVGADERPLAGLAGLCDWRMCGRLTRQLKDELFRGAQGEVVLTVPAGRIPAQRLFLFGLGPSAKRSAETLSDVLLAALGAVAKAGGSAVALSLPDDVPFEALSWRLVAAAQAAGLSRVVCVGDEGALRPALAKACEGKGAVRLEAASARGAGSLRPQASVVR